jgi:hypothetical protein
MTLVSKQEKLFEDIDINNYDKEPYVLLDNSGSELAKINRFGKEVTVFEASIQIIYDLLHLCTFKTLIFLIEKIKNFILKK